MAKTFDEICDDFENMSMVKRQEFMVFAFKDIYEAFVNIYGDNDEGYKHATLLVLYAVAADGRFDRREFEIMGPMLESIFGGEMSYDRAKSIVENTINDDDNIGAIEYVLKMKGRLIDYDEKLSGDFAMLMLNVCAIDGCINRDERQWLREVLRIPNDPAGSARPVTPFRFPHRFRCADQGCSPSLKLPGLAPSARSLPFLRIS